MVNLAEMEFESLQSGMKFTHPDYGVQIVMDLSTGQFGPVIRFHNCNVYSGELPAFGEEEGEVDIFQVLASRIYPAGADQWEYLGTATPEELERHGWRWWQVACPHCGFMHRQLSAEALDGARNCRACGMNFSRLAEIIEHV